MSWAEDPTAWLRWKPNPPGPMIVVSYDGITEYVGFVTGTSPSKDPDRVHVDNKATTVLWSDYPLPYPPPTAKMVGSEKIATHFWQRIHYLYRFRDPRTFPTVVEYLDEDQRAVCRRYIQTCRHIASSSVVRDAATVKVHNTPDGLVPESRFPPADAMAGFSAYLRQCYTPTERASFNVVRNLISRAAKQAAVDPRWHHDLQEWRRAVKHLDQKSILELLTDALVEREGWAPLPMRPRSSSPKKLIRTFFYGDQLHWGEHADAVLAEESEPRLAASQRAEFVESTLWMAHLYVGFSVLVHSAITPRGSLALPLG